MAETERIHHSKNEYLRQYLGIYNYLISKIDERMEKIINKPFTRTIATNFSTFSV